MWSIRKAQKKLLEVDYAGGYTDPAVPVASDLTASATEKSTRTGLLAEVWTLFESDSAPDFFEEGITITECLFREEDDMMDIFVTRNGQTVCFNIDNDTVFMSDDDSDADETVDLSELADLSDLQARMNHFVTTHTKSTLL